MADSITTCAANLCAKLAAGVAGLATPLPIIQDGNLQTGADAPAGGYIEVFPLRVIGERQHSRGGPVATFIGTFAWPLTINIPRGSGEGLASNTAEAIAAFFRQKIVGDLTVEEVDFEPLERQPEDPFFQFDLLIKGEKISDYTVAP
jgi:hypothetical protein